MDLKVFKCCRNKEFKHYCCKGCYGIFHDSCVVRRKGVVELSDYKIYCSKECQQLDIQKNEKYDGLISELKKLRQFVLDKDDIIAELKNKEKNTRLELNNELDKLIKENNEKDMYIQNLTRNTKDVIDTVCEQGKYANKQQTNYPELIESLKMDLMETNRINSELNEKLNQKIEEFKEIEQEFIALETTKNQMLVSIEVLTHDNEVYASEIRKLQNELSSNISIQCVRSVEREKPMKSDENTKSNNADKTEEDETPKEKKT